MEWHFHSDLICSAIPGVLCLVALSMTRGVATMSGLEPVTWGCSTWNTENWKHVLFHFQILEVHFSGGEFKSKKNGPVGRSYLPRFLVSIRVHYPRMEKAYPWGSEFPFKGCDQAEMDWLLFRIWWRRFIYWVWQWPLACGWYGLATIPIPSAQAAFGKYGNCWLVGC